MKELFYNNYEKLLQNSFLEGYYDALSEEEEYHNNMNNKRFRRKSRILDAKNLTTDVVVGAGGIALAKSQIEKMKEYRNRILKLERKKNEIGLNEKEKKEYIKLYSKLYGRTIVAGAGLGTTVGATINGARIIKNGHKSRKIYKNN